jgi:predicted amidohydrolase
MALIALLQMGMLDGETAKVRLARGLRLLSSLDRSVRMAVFPELWVTGFFEFDDYERQAEPLDGELALQFADAARSKRIWLHAGSIVERADHSRFNTSLLFDPEGRLTASYRKIHLFGYRSREAELLQQGVSPVVVPTELGMIGLATCYDLRFPEFFRCMLATGAEVFVVTSAWPFPRLEHWLVLARARAIENLAYVVACNAAGSQRGQTLLGNSLVVDPWGTPVARAGDAEQILYADLDLNRVHDWRDRFPSLHDRRL